MAILFTRTYNFWNDKFTQSQRLKPRVRLFDMSEFMHAYELVQLMIRYRIANRYPNRTFRPDQPIERGQLAYFLHKAYVAEQFHDITYDLLKCSGLSDLYSKDELRFVESCINLADHFVIVLNLRDSRNGHQQLLGMYGYDWKKDRFYDETIRLDASLDGKAKPKIFLTFK